MGETLHLKTLGSFEVLVAGKSLNIFESDKTRALLSYLAVESDSPHRRESLTGLFWPEAPDKHARHSLSQAVYSLRSTLNHREGLFTLTPQSIQLNHTNEIWLDIRIFQQLTHQVGTHCPGDSWVCHTCLEALESAAALHHGEFLAGFSLDRCEAFEAWLCQQRELLQNSLTKTLNRLVLNLQRQGSLKKALRYALQLATIDDLNEQAQRQVMRLLVASGQRAEALSHFYAFKSHLKKELGVDPEEETLALYQQILAEPEYTSFSANNQNLLPVALTPLLGRQAELDLVCKKLADPDCRLLTLLGQGGIGKTRLALEAGRDLAPLFPDGINLIDLDIQGIEKNLLVEIARGVGLELRTVVDLTGSRQANSIKEQLIDALFLKRMLLLLDGFEGMLDQSEEVSSLLRRLPGTKVLATSRVRLNLKSEQVILLEGLAYPDEDCGLDNFIEYPAVNLFMETARRAVPDLNLSPAEQQAVVEVCRLNQGLPLGILLAAAWVGILAPTQILQEIHKSLDFLSIGWRDLPDRQRNLRATFDHSWRLLSPELQRIFLRLGVFRSAFTADRALQVTGVALPQLKTLTDQSLLQPTRGNRFRLHDLLRQYAQEKLATQLEEMVAIHDRHCQVYLAALVSWEERLKSPEQFTALAEMDHEFADIRAAWEWASEHGLYELLHKSARALDRFLALRNRYNEGVSIFQTALQALDQPVLSPELVLVWANISKCFAHQVYQNHEPERAWRILERVDQNLHGEDSVNPERIVIHAEIKQHMATLKLQHYRKHWEALALCEQALTWMRSYGSPWDISRALLQTASCHDQIGNIFQKKQYAEEGLAIQQTLGDPAVLASLKTSLLYGFTLLGNHPEAIQIAQELSDYYQQVNTRSSHAFHMMLLGLTHAHAGYFEKAKAYFYEALPIFSQAEQWGNYEFTLYVMTSISMQTGDYNAAENFIATWPPEPVYMPEPLLGIFLGYLHLLEADYQQAEKEIQRYINTLNISPRLDMLSQAFALLGFCAYRTGKMNKARLILIQALENALQQGFFMGHQISLYTLALIFADAEELETAVELQALAEAQYAERSIMLDTIFGKCINALTAALPQETIQAAQERGRKLGLFETSAIYLEKLKKADSLTAITWNRSQDKEIIP